MCPASPMSIIALPQSPAQCSTVSRRIQGSLRLATTRLGKGRGVNGRSAASERRPLRRVPMRTPRGEKRCGSAGATSSAPATRPASSAPALTAVRQPKLCATSHTGSEDSRIERRTALVQRLRMGASQSMPVTRRAPGSRSCIQVCQCAGPLP